MSDGPLSEEERKALYTSLLTGMARSIREAPGSCERIGHDWGEWVCRDYYPDAYRDLRLGADPTQPAPNFAIRRLATRRCEQCGAEQKS